MAFPVPASKVPLRRSETLPTSTPAARRVPRPRACAGDRRPPRWLAAATASAASAARGGWAHTANVLTTRGDVPTSHRASCASVTLGKRFSRNFYVAYERGLDATMGTLYFFYDISRRLKLRGETGTESAIDLIYTISYD